MRMFYRRYYMEWKARGELFPHLDGITLRSYRKLSFVGIWASKAPHHTHFCFPKLVADQLRYMLWFEYYDMSFVLIKWMTIDCAKRHGMLAVLYKKQGKVERSQWGGC